MLLKEITDTTKKLNVLFVEDNEFSRNEISNILKRFFKKLDTASNGKEGLELFKKNSYDIVITDVNMPVMDGFEMLKEIKNLNKNVFTLIITAFNETEYFLEAIKIGIDAFILKPINFEQLKSALEKIVKNYRLKINADIYFSLLTQYQQVVDKSSIVCKINTEGRIIYMNDAFVELMKYNCIELGKQKYYKFLKELNKNALKDILNVTLNKNDVWRGVIKLRTKDGKIVYLQSAIKAIFERKKLVEFIFLGYDITEIMQPKKFLLDYISSHKKPVVIIVEIENFVNLRNLFGERLTETIENKFLEILREKVPEEIDEVYNIGNGQYALVYDCKGNIDFQLLLMKLKKFQKNINEMEISVDDISYDVVVYISVARGKKALENARYGMEIAKKEKQMFVLADGILEENKKKVEKNIKMLHIIKDAIINNKIVCAFQPIVDNKNGKIVKYETLMRIKQGNVLVPPDEFIEIAKKAAYYSELTKIMLTKSFKKLRQNQNVSVNISEIDIARKNVREYIYDLLEKNKNIAHRITFELLEDEDSSKNEELEKFIKEIKKFGVKIAIDDFGSGYSNFYRLKKYKPDYLKIDGTLIKDIHKDKFSYSIVKSIVEFAKQNNIKTIAEYVENEEIFNKIKEIGVDYSQGFYFGKPLLFQQIKECNETKSL
jgi:PAS domain S-box-containing protein